jgi:hypothetical protein
VIIWYINTYRIIHSNRRYLYTLQIHKRINGTIHYKLTTEATITSTAVSSNIILHTWWWPHWSKHVVKNFWKVKTYMMCKTFKVNNFNKFFERCVALEPVKPVTFDTERSAAGCYNIILSQNKFRNNYNYNW